MGFFLVERYVPSMTDAEIASGARRVAEAPGIRHVLTILIAAEDTCLSVYQAPDVATVERASAQASFSFDRIVPVAPLPARRDDWLSREPITGS